MSRKQRRTAGPPGAAPTLGSAAPRTSAGMVGELFAAAGAQHQAGALAEAERRDRYILALSPNHADSLNHRGVLSLHGGNASAAVELIGKAIKINNRAAEYHYNIALAYRALDRMDEVGTHLERAIALRNDHALAHLNLG